MPIFLKPHSDEWFAAIRFIDPERALEIAFRIERLGTRDVCSLCNSRVVTDYWIVDQSMPPDAVATLKLCEDCYLQRQAAGDELEIFVSH